MVRVFALGKIKRTLMDFEKEQKLSATDKLLLKGFYTSNRVELQLEPAKPVLDTF